MPRPHADQMFHPATIEYQPKHLAQITQRASEELRFIYPSLYYNIGAGKWNFNPLFMETILSLPIFCFSISATFVKTAMAPHNARIQHVTIIRRIAHLQGHLIRRLRLILSLYHPLVPRLGLVFSIGPGLSVHHPGSFRSSAADWLNLMAQSPEPKRKNSQQRAKDNCTDSDQPGDCQGARDRKDHQEHPKEQR